MDGLQQQLGSILSDPEMMQKIAAMAQSLNLSPPAPPASEEAAPPLPDMQMLQKLSGLASQSAIDNDQRNLLTALRPYLSHDRIAKLEKAMRAAKLAGIASTFLNSGGLSFLTGR